VFQTFILKFAQLAAKNPFGNTTNDLTPDGDAIVLIVSPLVALNIFKSVVESPTASKPLDKTANPYTQPDAGIVNIALW
jgi:hypothetical protein